MKSDLSGFYELNVDERLRLVQKICNLTDEEVHTLKQTATSSIQTFDRMIENVIGTVELPMGVATNFHINGKDVLIPMSIEEPSVVAAASHAAKLCRPVGFKAHADEPIMIGQIQIMNAVPGAKDCILRQKENIIEMANSKDSTLVKMGGGMKDIEVFERSSSRGKMLIVHILVDVRDAMGANAVNTMCESVAPFIEELTGGRSVLKIISNLAVYRLARAQALWRKEDLGEELIEAMLDAYELAAVDPFRCATHNKGIMNGVDAVLIATGNDFRAAEAGAHAYASYHGRYQPLTHYEKDEDGNLIGKIELPLVAGIVGGATKTNPVAAIALKILDVHTAKDLAVAAAAVGLANNFAALRAMAKEGIQAGHMRLHAANIALTAGATHEEVPLVVKRMVRDKQINVAYATDIIAQIRNAI